jgi:hypothetical protein
MRALVLGLLFALLVPACGGRGERRFGERCESDNECQHGLCVGGVAGDAPVCTTSCARASDCPTGWSCTGVTQHQVLVCASGGSTPFGF